MSSIAARLTAALAERYSLEREIAQGGMATVYCARDLRHDRMVAMKVVKPELSAVLGPERFLAEIRVTAHLQHPHILPLFDPLIRSKWLPAPLCSMPSSTRPQFRTQTTMPTPPASAL
ncbi:MAG: hypothetical protein H0T58_10490 [Gemmatimonadales bacterium]|nr:hypothetical protein [Gemmatimonadales bacterium]